MKNFVAAIIALVVLLGFGIMLEHRSTLKVREAEKSRDLLRIQKEFLERAGWIRSNPDFKSYREEMPSFLNWYFNEIDGHERQFGGNLNYDDYLAELDGKTADKSSGRKDEVQTNNKRSVFEFAKKMFDQLRQGNYAPPWSFTDKGIRLDILQPALQLKAGKQEVRFPIILWGSQREPRGEGLIKKMISSGTMKLQWKVLDKADKVIGEISVEGLPDMRIDYPERYIAEFPPQTLLGYVTLEPLPSEANRLESTIQLASKSSGGRDILSSFVWKLDVPPEWKLQPGEKWEGAQEQVGATAD